MKLAPALVITLAACGGPAKPVPASTQVLVDVTTYYVGTTRVWSPDGQRPYSPETETVVERTVSLSKHQIVESVLIEGKMVATTLTQTEVENVFAATVEGDLFTGTLTYAGPAWAWTGWDYDITLAGDGGTITGHADVTDTEITTKKQFADAGGTVRALIQEHVHAVPEAEFVAKRTALTNAAVAPEPPRSSAQTTYYVGEVMSKRSDGAGIDAPHLTVLARTLDADAGTIVEVSGANPAIIAIQTDTAGVFDVGRRTQGLRCIGEAWAWTHCQYTDFATVTEDFTATGLTRVYELDGDDGYGTITTAEYQVATEAEYRDALAELTGDF